MWEDKSHKTIGKIFWHKHISMILISIIYAQDYFFSEGEDVEMQPKISASELLSILGNLAYEYPQGTKRQMRFGLF